MRSSWISTITGGTRCGCGPRLPTMRASGAHQAVVAADVRRGLQRPVPVGNSGPLATRIVENVFDVNRRIYGFRLVGVEDPTQVLCYRSGSDDEYVAHTDIGPVTSLRKLSFSLLLSDPATFEGGDLDFGSPFALARAEGRSRSSPASCGTASPR